MKAYPEYLEKFRYWHWYNNQEFSGYRPVEKIGPAVQKPGYFLFIGDYLPKDASKVDDEDLQTIIEAFEYLMPVYRFVQLDDTYPFPETRIARICWNTNGWVKPSGRVGKSKSPSHEKEHGFGFEEWLFDRDKVTDGWQYGFLEPVHKYHSSYEAYRFKLLLYTFNSESQQAY